ncbi:xanthine dehydrogenase family protein subunit M [Ramlibacter sp. G-1-2-2]|uniref:Xanthine dehydrogenase family protein subunit M n=1 Tax=Ramlibacter agri TaxID=2728837 RepID=A0A848HFH5_9BURK|nr:xanthine dehydrogenase family protein subunit M [Ramlibacter agri]
MIPSAFEYHAPTSLPDALALLGQFGDGAKLLAGGHSLLPMMKLRFAEPAHLIDLRRIPDLRGIVESGGEIHIGAMTTENEIVWSKLLADKLPLLVEGARAIADPQVRYRGTIGGDISHGDPGNDHPALMLALDASFVLRSARGERVVQADAFFQGLYATDMAPDEVLTRIRIPVPPPGTGWSYQKLKRKVGDFATAASAVLLRLQGGKVASASIALTNVATTPLKARDAENFLAGQALDEASLAEAARLAMAICDPVADQRGDADYKRAMAGEMTRRALLAASSRASH